MRRGSFLERLDHPLVDFWLPRMAAESRDPVRLQRLRIVSAFLQALVGLALVFGTLDASSGLYALSLTSFGGVPLALAILFRMRAGASPEVLALAASSTLFLVLVSNAALNGGLEAPAVFLLPLVPTLALLMGVHRLALALVGLCAVTVLGAFGIEHTLKIPFPRAMTPEHLTFNRALVVVAACVMVYGAFLLIAGFGRWMQARLLEAEAERLDRILDAAGDAIVRVGVDDRVVSANAAAHRLFQRGSLVGAASAELLPEVQQLTFASAAVELLAACGGESVPVEASSTLLRDGRVLVIRDIRDRVAAQAALSDALADARAASLAKSRFLASMSHELRTPLNAVIGYAEMVAEDIEAGVPPEDPSDLESIVGSARHLLALIDQVLDLAKVEAGRMEVELRDVPLEAFLEELATVGRTLAKAGGNAFRADLLEGGGRIQLDEVRVRQIVFNLLSNAAKFCKEGEITLVVRWEDETLVIEVRDTGIGMTEAQLEAVWDEFAQAEISTSRVYGGTGLGLPLVRRLTELLGGRLTATSAPGVGTSFTVVLPAIPGE